MYDNTSPRYQVSVYRNPETLNKESILDEFLKFCDRESQNVTEEEVKHIQQAITEFLGYDIHKVEAGEKFMLTRWQESVK